MLFRSLFTGPRNDLQVRIQSSRNEHALKIGGVRGGCGDQPSGPLDLRLAQSLLLRSVAGDDQPVLRGEALALGFGALQHHKRHRLAPQLPRHTASYAPHAADNVVPVEPPDFALHAPPSEEALQLEIQTK